jgi:hypothetical protein
MDGHPRQNPAYRPATEKALETGLFLCLQFAGDSSGLLRGGLTAVSVEPLGAVARRGLVDCAGYGRSAKATLTASAGLPHLGRCDGAP